jgi:hypothetical protein
MTKEELQQLEKEAAMLGMKFTDCAQFYEIQYAVINYHMIDIDDNYSSQEVRNILHSLSKRDIVPLPF